MANFPWLAAAFFVLVGMMFVVGKIIERRAARGNIPEDYGEI